MRKSQYYAANHLSTRYYDALTALDSGLNGDIAFYAQGLGPGEQVLEIGCGTGRVAFGLAQLGLSVLGIDIATGMLEIARRKQARLPANIATRVQFLLSDATTFAAPIVFKRVLFPFYTFNFLQNRKARLQALDVAARHLGAGGNIILHCIPIDRLRVVRAPEQPQPKADISIRVGRDEWLDLYWRQRRVDVAKEVTTQSVFYRLRKTDGAVIEESLEELVFTWVSDQEIAFLARKLGFRQEAVLTSFSSGQVGRERIYRLAK